MHKYQHYWRVTDPARGVSVEIQITDGADSEKALLAGFDGDRAGYEFQIWSEDYSEDGYEFRRLSYSNWLESKGYKVEFITKQA